MSLAFDINNLMMKDKKTGEKQHFSNANPDPDASHPIETELVGYGSLA